MPEMSGPDCITVSSIVNGVDGCNCRAALDGLIVVDAPTLGRAIRQQTTRTAKSTGNLVNATVYERPESNALPTTVGSRDALHNTHG